MSSLWQTLSNVFTDVRGMSGKDSTTLPDSVLLPIANKYYYVMVRELIGLNEDLYAEISYTDLVVDQREYTLPTDNTSSTYGGGLIKLQRVEVTYNATDWYVADPISLSQIPDSTITDADLDAQFEKSDPVYWHKDRSVWLAPVPDSTDVVTTGNKGLYIYWIKRPNEMSATSDIPDLPKDWLSVLSDGILHDIYRRFNRTADARDSIQNWYNGLARMKDLESHIEQEQQYILKAQKKRYD